MRNIKLKDIASNKKYSIVDGPFGSSLKNSDYVNEGIPVLQGKNITGDTFNFYDVRFITNQKAEKLARSKVIVGDYLLVKIGSIGYLARITSLNEFDYAIIPANLAKISIDETKIYPTYFEQFFKQPITKWRLNKLSSKTAQPALSLSKIKDFEISVPDTLADQIKIATVLSKAEALIKQRKENIDLLDEFLKSTFYELFGDPVLQVKNKGLPIKKLGDICDVRDGTHDSPRYVSEGYPLITSKNLTLGKIDMTDINLISKSDYENINKRSKVDRGDIIMPMIGTIGNPVIVEDEPEFAIKNVALIKFTQSSPVNNIFIKHLFESNYFERVVQELSRGGTQKFISLGAIRNIQIPIPGKPLIGVFKNIYEKTSLLKKQFEISLNDLENLYGSLSQRAFKEELDLRGLVIDHIIPVSKGGSDAIKNLQAISEKENIKKADKLPISLDDFFKKFYRIAYREATRVLRNSEDAKDVVQDLIIKLYDRFQNLPIDNLEAYIKTAAKYSALSFLKKRKLDTMPLEFFPEDFDFSEEQPDERETLKKGEILWEKVSIQQVSNWITAKYADYHFSSEMLLRFLQEEQLTKPYYFSSEELKKFPKFNSLDDLHTLIFSALNGENPYLKLKQVFYNGTEKIFSLNLSEEDIEMTNGRNDEQMTGIYFTIE